MISKNNNVIDSRINDILKNDGFKRINLSDKKIFDKYFEKYNSKISEYTFTNLYTWSTIRVYKFKIIDQHLVIGHYEDNSGKNRIIFLQPIGEKPEEIIVNLLNKFPGSKVIRVNQSVAEVIKKKYNEKNKIAIIDDRDNYDYVYSVDKLIELKGKKYRGKRNLINRFKRNNNPLIEKCHEVETKKYLDLHEKWCNIKNCKNDKHLFAEDIAIRKYFEHREKFDVCGIGIKVNNKLIGFSLGEKLNDNTFVNHFEKADFNYTGIYQFLLVKLANYIKKVHPEIKFINREQDLGFESLRKAKMDWDPKFLVEKFTIKKVTS